MSNLFKKLIELEQFLILNLISKVEFKKRVDEILSKLDDIESDNKQIDAWINSKLKDD